ncbi:MAG: DUF4238 domain-containing protein, partial [Cytophagaceae bacterium]
PMDKKFFEVKKKHHHVWADYLRRWSHDGVKVFHTTQKRNIINESVRGVAMEPHFYRLTSLSDFDVSVILTWSGRADSELQKLHRSYLSDFLRFQKSQQIYQASGRSDPTVERSIKALESKLIENLHSAHEREVSPIMRALAEGQLSVLYENKSILDFTSFLGHQITRTKTFKDKVFANPDESVPGMKEFSASMKNSWWFLSYMLGMNLGRELYLFRNRYTHTLLHNDSAVPFITSDQPVINVHDAVWNDESSAQVRCPTPDSRKNGDLAGSVGPGWRAPIPPLRRHCHSRAHRPIANTSGRPGCTARR